MTTLAAELPATVIDTTGRAAPVLVELVWDTRRPLYFDMVINGSPDFGWIIGRDLLAAGIAARAGLMDVVVYPDGNPNDAEDLVIALASPTGTCKFRVDRFDVDMLVSRTIREIPLGAEIAVPDTVPAEWRGLIGDGSAS